MYAAECPAATQAAQDVTRRNVEDWEHRGILCCYSINTEELVASIGKKEEIACVMACYAATCTYLVLL